MSVPEFSLITFFGGLEKENMVIICKNVLMYYQWWCKIISLVSIHTKKNIAPISIILPEFVHQSIKNFFFHHNSKNIHNYWLQNILFLSTQIFLNTVISLDSYWNSFSKYFSTWVFIIFCSPSQLIMTKKMSWYLFGKVDVLPQVDGRVQVVGPIHLLKK